MKLHLVTHFYNEELLLPHFIKHHKDMFDSAICINHQSTDNSVEIIRTLAPDWKIVDSKIGCFDAGATDEEVMEWESTLPPDDFKITLNITEFIWNHDFRDKIEGYRTYTSDFSVKAWGMRSFALVDPPGLTYEGKLEDNWWKHTHGYLSEGSLGPIVMRHWRFVHCGHTGLYSPGRHSTGLSSNNTEDLYLVHYTFAPWPQSKERKLQIQHKIPQSDKDTGRGVQHIQTPESLIITYNNHLAVSGDLLKNEHFKYNYENFLNKKK